MEFNDAERKNIHDDLDELFDGDQILDSPQKKKVVFKESGSGQKQFVKLDIGKVKQMEIEDVDAPLDPNQASKKKKKNKKKKNKNKESEQRGSQSGRDTLPQLPQNIEGLNIPKNPQSSVTAGYMSHRNQTPATKLKKRNYDLEYTPLKFKLGESFYEDTDSSEDEGMPDYKIGGYHCMHIGEVLVDRYVIIQKLGWGHFSTVWLAKDIKYDTYVALKIQRSASQYLEAAFDEVEILDQCSSYWMKKEWLSSLKEYYVKEPERLKGVTGNDSYCVQLLNCFLHHGPHGKHFVTVFEILGVNLLEVIKRYNYKGAPLPIVRTMARQCLTGLDYLHRMCKVIHTDLKPENVSLCLTDQEILEIKERGQLKSTNMHDSQIKQIRKLTGTIDNKTDQQKKNASKSIRGRGNKDEDDEVKNRDDALSKQAKKAFKRKLQRQRKKERKNLEKASGAPTHKDQAKDTPQQILEESNDILGDAEGVSPNIQSKKGAKQGTQKPTDALKLVQMNESAPRKKKTFEYEGLKKPGEQPKPFALKDLDPEQMRDINDLLKEYIEVPRAHTLPKRTVIPSPDMRPEALNDESLSDVQRQQLLQQQIYFQQTGIPIEHRYEYDIIDVQEKKQQMDEFLFYRKKFEKSQRAKAANIGDPKDGQNLADQLDLNEDMFDPQNMQQQIQEERAKKRGPKLDETVKLKICDLGNGCWTYHHFSTEIQTRQYRSPEVIIGAKYNTTADNWSLACMMFEMATGDFLFEPRNSNSKKFSQDDDHLAQMMELLGPMPRSMALGGIKYRKMFDRAGQLRRIRGLKYWPLHRVLHEKYKFKEAEAKAFADFLLPMLTWDPNHRASAQQCLQHPWLQRESNFITKMSDEEYQKLQDRKKAQEAGLMKKDFEDDELNIETSKLQASETEQNHGDDELSDISGQEFLERLGTMFSSDDEDTDDSWAINKTKKQKMTGKDMKQKAIRKREQIFIKRDIAEGRTFNNSFTGPYPEETDHLHIDKGPNPQFEFMKYLKT